MSSRAINVFFYGSYLNPDVLAEVDLRPTRFEAASLTGYAISIEPLANLERQPDATCFGMLAQATHAELTRLYAHAQNVLGGVYLPEAVLVRLLRADGGARFEPALCYISSSLQPAAATDAYVERILAPARRYGFPAWYLEHLESFKAGRA